MPLSVQEQRTADEVQAGVVEAHRLIDHLFSHFGLEKPALPEPVDPEKALTTAADVVKVLADLDPAEVAKVRKALGLDS